MSHSTLPFKPNEQQSKLPYSLIDYLANIPGAEIDERQRVMNTVLCKDADYIPKVANAGEVVRRGDQSYQIMHNGLKVAVDSYYGDWGTQLIKELKGHHEPQEEKVFYEVLKRARPNSWMIELGAYWSYYSMWFHTSVPGARNLCCEPDPENKSVGEKNAELNNFQDIRFLQSAAGKDDKKIISFDTGSVSGKVDVPIRTIDSLMEEYRIERLELLHMDVQGAELDALRGAEKMIKSGRVRFVFISTHHYLISRHPNIHQECINYITALGGHIVTEHDIHESYSGDGLIVASFDDNDKDIRIDVSRNRMRGNQFRSYMEDMELSFQAYDYILQRLIKQNSQVEKLNGRIASLDAQLKEGQTTIFQLKKDIDHLSNLHIPAAGKEFIKSVLRSIKARVIRFVWGRDNIYLASDNLKSLAKESIVSKDLAIKAIEVIQSDDALNLTRLTSSPSKWRVSTYETLRRASHLPRKSVRRLRRIR